MSLYSKIVDDLNAAARTKDAAKVALASRDAVRSAVKFLFEKKGIEWDEKATLLELVHSRTVEEFVAVPEQVAALDFVRMLGGNAEHGTHVKKTQAVRAEKTARCLCAGLIAEEKQGVETDVCAAKYVDAAEFLAVSLEAVLELFDALAETISDLVEFRSGMNAGFPVARLCARGLSPLMRTLCGTSQCGETIGNDGRFLQWAMA